MIQVTETDALIDVVFTNPDLSATEANPILKVSQNFRKELQEFIQKRFSLNSLPSIDVSFPRDGDIDKFLTVSDKGKVEWVYQIKFTIMKIEEVEVDAFGKDVPFIPTQPLSHQRLHNAGDILLGDKRIILNEKLHQAYGYKEAASPAMTSEIKKTDEAPAKVGKKNKKR